MGFVDRRLLLLTGTVLLYFPGCFALFYGFVFFMGSIYDCVVVLSETCADFLIFSGYLNIYIYIF